MPLGTANIEDTFNCKEEGIKRLLSGILNLNIQHEPNEKAIITTINRLLSTAKHRKEGLEYLSLIIRRCSASIITENALVWLNHCLIKFQGDILREMKLKLIVEIIEVAHDEADFNKRFISDFISQVLESCLIISHVNSYECVMALTVLTAILKYYPSWFGVQKQKIEGFVLAFLDNEDKKLVQASSVAFHYLQQAGSSGAAGVNYKTNFSQNFHKICVTLHRVLDKFFDNELSEGLEEQAFEFQEDPTYSSYAVLHVHARRVQNLFTFLETFIKTGYPVAKETRPKELLEVLNRVLSRHKCITGDSVESLEKHQFSLLLLEIQCAALKLLRLSLLWYKSNILPFSYQVSKIVVDCISRSHNCDCFMSSLLYQESTYKVLSEWVRISKSSFHSHFQTQLLECLLKDITPVKVQVTLTISEGVSGKKSQKAKRKAMINRIISSGDQSKEPNIRHEKNSRLFALTALQSLLESTRLAIKPILLKDLYKSIFDSLTNIQYPYTDPKYHAKLYEVLVALYHQHYLPILPPLQTSLDLLSRGVNEGDPFIANACQKGLRLLETLCQPVSPSLYLHLDREANESRPQDTEVEDLESEKGSVSSSDSTVKFSDHKESSDQAAFSVHYPASEHSTIEDGLNAENNDHLEVEELGSENSQPEEIGNEMNLSDHPIVTAPSEDGNEILEDLNSSQKETATDETSEKDSVKISDEIEQEKDETEPSETISTDPVKNTDFDKETNKDIPSKPVQPISGQEECEEPESKRARITEEEAKEADPDAGYLEDDSFVDAVKDYY